MNTFLKICFILTLNVLSQLSTYSQNVGGSETRKILFPDGKKFGPYDPGKISENNPAFCKSGGENWLLTLDSKLFINGTPVKNLANEYISPSNIWISEDGKRYAVIVPERIEFSDGKVYKDPLKIRISKDNNKVTIWWLMYENGKDIVLYSKII